MDERMNEGGSEWKKESMLKQTIIVQFLRRKHRLGNSCLEKKILEKPDLWPYFSFSLVLGGLSREAAYQAEWRAESLGVRK